MFAQIENMIFAFAFDDLPEYIVIVVTLTRITQYSLLVHYYRMSPSQPLLINWLV